jgi:Subtilase family
MALNAVDLMTAPEQIFHWIPGEMILVVRLHRPASGEAQEALVEQIRSQLNTFLARYSLVLEPYGSYGRWREAAALPPIRRRSFVFGLHKPQPLLAIFFHVRHANPALPDPMPMALSYLQRHLEEIAQTGLHIVSAMPNWLVTAAPVFYEEGGPAAPPRPAPRLDLPTSGNPPIGWHVSFVDPMLQFDPNGAEDVLIAVLDTAHHPDRLLSAATRPELKRNWLLQRLAANLRSDNGSFEIEYDRYPVTSDVRTGQDAYGESRYYSMPDHGIFVSGLLRDVVPHARIRLIRVLDDFGGSDLYNFFAALTDLEQELVSGAIRRLVINLSLLVMPDSRLVPYIWFKNRKWETTQLAGVTRILMHIEEGLRLLFESLYAHGTLIIAAAGNDSTQSNRQGKPRRPPRTPARYESVLGVSSVNSRFAPSRFANMANVPPFDTGVATFGGDGYGVTDAMGLPDAVRGIYLSPTFPGGEQNTSGWADWTGTSFATPIISGLGAHLLAQGYSASNALNRIVTGQARRTDKLFGPGPDVPELLANVIRVQQRFGVR